MKKDVVLSASQIDTYSDCHRKWGFRYLNKIKTPQHPAAELGTRVHQVLADYLETGKPLQYGSQETRIALPGIRFLPKPGVAKVEQHFTFEDGGVKFQGYIDFEYEQDGRLIVGDHKTCASFSYIKTPWGLLEGVQSSIYAKKALRENDKDKVTLRWIYYRSKGKARARLVEAEYSRKQLALADSVIMPTAKEMLAHHEAGNTAKDLRFNLNACQKYGACPFIGQCRALKSKKPKTKVDQLKEKEA